jgi:ribosome-associated translation inhibitor RaiA
MDMKIHINTDKNVSGNQDRSDFITGLISEELSRFNDQITRVEVHLSDEDGKKAGQNDKRCLLEARLEGRQPIAVTDHAGSHEEAVSGAIDKLKTSLETIRGRLRNH